MLSSAQSLCRHTQQLNRLGIFLEPAFIKETVRKEFLWGIRMACHLNSKSDIKTCAVHFQCFLDSAHTHYRWPLVPIDA